MFRKTLLTILCLFVLSGSAYAQTDYFIDFSCATPGDGTTGQCDGGADDAFDSIFGADGLADGDVAWVRKAQTETRSASVAWTYDQEMHNPVYIIGWPRSAHNISSSDWTNGSTGVVVDDADMDREQHQGRFITAPDGFDYLITRVVDASNIVIDRPYAGATSGNDATAVIKADDLPEGITKPSDPNNWDADADDLPTIDLSGGAYSFVWNQDDNWVVYNLNMIGGTNEIIDVSNIGTFVLHGCLLKQDNNFAAVYLYGSILATIERTIIEGDSASESAQNGLYVYSPAIKLINSAIYNMGNSAILMNDDAASYIYFENVNLGVELPNDSYDIECKASNHSSGRDVKLGGTNGDININVGAGRQGHSMAGFTFANYQKVLGAWKDFYIGTTLEKVAVVSTNANKKLSDNIIEITPPTTANRTFRGFEQEIKVFESRKTYDAGTYNVKVWIYNDTGNTLNDTTFSDDILMRCRAEAGSYGDATTEYVSMPWTYSDEIDILDAADADDWDYLQCDSVVVGVSGSKIYCEVLVSTYDAQADVILIDPVTTNP